MKNQRRKQQAYAFIWNIIGSVFNSATSFLLLIFVTRILGEYDAGVFALGFANAQLMLTIGRFGMRAYQATDINYTINFSTYLTSRFITNSLMLLASIIYILSSGYTFEKGIVVFSICFIKMVDAIEDVFHGLFQQNGRIDIAGRSLTVRNVMTIMTFILVIAVSKDLLVTCITTGIVSLIACLLLNIPRATNFASINLKTSRKDLALLLTNCSPLFLGSFLSLLIYNIPKYTIDIYSTEVIQTYYSILFMPAFVINLLSEFIFKPLLTDIALIWNENRIKQFVSYILRLLLAIIIITVVVIIGGYFIGSELLSVVYGVNLIIYKNELVILLTAGGFSAAVYLLYNILTTIRKQMSILIGYLAVALSTIIICPILVKGFGIKGAALSYLTSSILLLITFSIILTFAIILKSRKTTNE